MSTQGWVYPLPSITKSVLIRYEPTWLITVLIGKSQKTIKIKLLKSGKSGELTVSTPDLLLSHLFKPPWDTQKLFEPPQELYYLNQVSNFESNKVITKPYRLSNVYSNAAICFGSTSPFNLRQANNIYWESVFTDDGSLFYDEHDKKCSIKVHDFFGHSGHRCPCACCHNVCGCKCNCNLESDYLQWINNYPDSSPARFIDRTYFFQGNNHSYYDGASYLFMSNNFDLAPKKFYTKTRHGYYLIGTAKRNQSNWLVNANSYSLTLQDNQITYIGTND